jgi:hypothetical protein
MSLATSNFFKYLASSYNCFSRFKIIEEPLDCTKNLDSYYDGNFRRIAYFL